MGCYLGGGSEWCYSGLIGVQNSGAMLGDHRIYLGHEPGSKLFIKGLQQELTRDPKGRATRLYIAMT